MKKILCVIRASTVYQETESQKQELIQFCLSKGFTIDELDFIEVAGASARKCNPAYIKMLEDIKERLLNNNSLSNVALWHLNRLGRVESKLHEMKEFFVRHGIQVYIKEPAITLLDDNGELSAAGSITFSVYASMVKYETDEMFAKMNRGKERQKAEGKYIGGTILYGYKVNNYKNIVIDEEAADKVRLIFNLYSTGRYTITELLDELKDRGLSRYTGGEFTYWNIIKLMGHDGYCGNDVYPELISKDMFNRCAEIRRRNATAKFTKAPENRLNLAVGILKCSCGCNYIRSTNHYLCSTAGSKFKMSCGAPSLKIEIAHQILHLIIRYGWLHEFLGQKDNKKVDINEQIELTKTKITVQQAEIQGLNARQDKLEHAYYVEGKLSDSKFQNMCDEISTKIDAAEGKINAFMKQLADLQVSLNSIGETSDAEKMYMSLFETRMDDNDMEHLKNIKVFANSFLLSMTIDYIDDHRTRRMKTVEIKVNDKLGNTFVFRYSPLVSAYGKGKCPLTMQVKTQFKAVFVASDEPWLFGSLVYNPEVENTIQETYGLPKISAEEFRKVLRK